MSAVPHWRSNRTDECRPCRNVPRSLRRSRDELDAGVGAGGVHSGVRDSGCPPVTPKRYPLPSEGAAGR
eukprot:8561115-Alexandrium_andersonii.AAC.1